MSIRTSWAAVVICASALFAVQAHGQDCQSCNQTAHSHESYAAPVYQQATAEDCYGRGLLHGSTGPFASFREQCNAHYEHLCRLNEVVYRRNAAWPKPFACADRQLYFQIWDPMIDQGWRGGCVFTNEHFIDGTANLNKAGQAKLAAIMKNNANGQKAFYIERDQPQDIADARLTTIRSTVDQWYGLDRVTEIAFTDLAPLRGEGLRTENVNRLYGDGTPAPIIPVASGTGSTTTIGAGQ